MICSTLLICSSIPIVISDIRSLRIPDVCILTGFIVLLSVLLVLRSSSIGRRFLEAVMAFALLWGVRLLSQGKLGMGDVKYSSFIAACSGLYAWFEALFHASVLALIFAFFLVVFQKKAADTPIPFAPFLLLGIIIVTGRSFIQW